MPFQTPVPVMVVVFAVLLLLPLRLSRLQLLGLAFFLWLTGGIVLAWRGAGWLLSPPAGPPDPGILALCLGLALAIGFAKGQFVLSKTSRRNIERIHAMAEPQRPLRVYSARSWIVIGIMVAISVGLNLARVDLLWRGTINLAIGLALVVSSLAYLKALQPSSPPPSA